MDQNNDEMDVSRAELGLKFRTQYDVFEAMIDLAKELRNE